MENKADLNKLFLFAWEAFKNNKKGDIRWFEIAAKKGSQAARKFLDEINNKDKSDRDKALAIYKIAAEEGVAEAQGKLGYMYYIGEGVEQDYTQAAYWYGKAAEAGVAEAQVNLGVMRRRGIGVNKDDTEAFKLFTAAAEAEGAAAQFNLGIMYYVGEGVEQDYEHAIEYFEKAVGNGLSEAISRICDMHRDQKNHVKN